MKSTIRLEAGVLDAAREWVEAAAEARAHRGATSVKKQNRLIAAENGLREAVKAMRMNEQDAA